MPFLSRDDVNIFPSALRTYKPAGKFTSEENLTGILKSITDRDSFIIKLDDIDVCDASHPWEFIVNGYYIKLTGKPAETSTFKYHITEPPAGETEIGVYIHLHVDTITGRVIQYRGTTSLDSPTLANFIVINNVANYRNEDTPENVTVYHLKIAGKNGVISQENKIKFDISSIGSDGQNLEELMDSLNELLTGGDPETTSAGSATQIPVITTNSKGRITGLDSVPIELPELNNGVLTIQNGAGTSAVFTANQATDTTVTINKNFVGLGNVGNFKAVSTVSGQNLSATEKAAARANIGASDFDKDYDKLNNKPVITLNGIAEKNPTFYAPKTKRAGNGIYIATQTTAGGVDSFSYEPDYNVSIGFASHIGLSNNHPAIGDKDNPVYINSDGTVTPCDPLYDVRIKYEFTINDVNLTLIFNLIDTVKHVRFTSSDMFNKREELKFITGNIGDSTTDIRPILGAYIYKNTNGRNHILVSYMVRTAAGDPYKFSTVDHEITEIIPQSKITITRIR